MTRTVTTKNTVFMMFVSMTIFSACILGAFATTTLPPACNGASSIGAYRLMNSVQCRKLCWYISECSSFGYRDATAPGYNCVLYTDKKAPAEVTADWTWRPVSGEDVKNGCSIRPCGSAQVCVPAPTGSLYKCLPLSDRLVQPETFSPCTVGQEQSSATTQAFATTSDVRDAPITANKESSGPTTVFTQEAVTTPGVPETSTESMSTQEHVETSAASDEESSHATTAVQPTSVTSDASIGETKNATPSTEGNTTYVTTSTGNKGMHTTLFTSGLSTDGTKSAGGKTTDTTVSATDTISTADVTTSYHAITVTDTTLTIEGKSPDTTLSHTSQDEIAPGSIPLETTSTPRSCPDPENVTDASVTVYGKNPGDEAEVTCNKHYVIVPRNASSIIRCQAGTLQWEPFLGTCFKVKFVYDPPTWRHVGPLPWNPEQGSQYCVRMAQIDIGQVWVNFQVGDTNNNIGLRFEFQYEFGKNSLSRIAWNIKVDGAFGSPEILSDTNPFALDEVFALTFTVYADWVEVTVHGFANYSIPIGGSGQGSYIMDTNYITVAGSACAVHYVDMVSPC